MERVEPEFGESPRRDDADRMPRRDFAHHPPRASRVPVVVFLVLLVALIGTAAYYFWPRELPAPAQPIARAPVLEPMKPAEPAEPKHPVAPEATEQPLPALKDSDGTIAAALSAMLGLDAFGKMFVPEHLVRNFVATVDNLPREEVARRVNPLRPVPGVPATTGKDEMLALAPANAARYAPYIKVMDAVETPKVLAFYRRNYPLFQEAYQELGYPKGYFNDRLVEVIDHLLATPEPAGTLYLVQPKVLYEYRDELYEESSAGRKMMLRLGKENRDKVKSKLQEIRAGIVSMKP